MAALTPMLPVTWVGPELTTPVPARMTKLSADPSDGAG